MLGAMTPGTVAAAGDAGTAPVCSFDRRVLGIGLLVVAVLMALSDRYGFQRDELYMVESGRHLQASYVDQPLLAPLLARISLAVFGVWLPGLRLWAALVSGATVVVGGLTARELGGNRRAQLLAAAATATMPVLLGGGHVANTTPGMILACAGLGLVVVRIGRTGDPRWWLAGGAVAGVGAEDNHLVGLYAIALVIGALVAGGRRLVLNRWFAGGAAIAVVLMVPDLWWQAQHEWAAIAMSHALNQENGGAGNIAIWIVGQFGLTTLAMVWVWVAGLRFLWRSGQPMWRALVWAYGLLYLVFALTTGAQVYYLAGVYVSLVAAGAVPVDGWLHERPARLRVLAAATVITTAASVLVVLPVLPAANVGWTYKTSAISGESIGWPQLVSTVRTAWVAIPAPQRASAVIFTADYSEAAAINELGRGTGLPTAVSGHNSYWWWGPGNPDATTVLAVAPGPDAAGDYAAYLRQFFTSVRVVATLSNPDGIHNIEWGGHVYLCTGPRQPWGQMWPRLRHYD
jgi:4-amino-4-deoxy-L-arabinose transferase-like glycosyltransferase